jgi:hypothetical protein
LIAPFYAGPDSILATNATLTGGYSTLQITLITAGVTTLFVTILFVLLLNVLCKCYPKLLGIGGKANDDDMDEDERLLELIQKRMTGPFSSEGGIVVKIEGTNPPNLPLNTKASVNSTDITTVGGRFEVGDQAPLGILEMSENIEIQQSVNAESQKIPSPRRRRRSSSYDHSMNPGQTEKCMQRSRTTESLERWREQEGLAKRKSGEASEDSDEMEKRRREEAMKNPKFQTRKSMEAWRCQLKQLQMPDEESEVIQAEISKSKEPMKRSAKEVCSPEKDTEELRCKEVKKKKKGIKYSRAQSMERQNNQAERSSGDSVGSEEVKRHGCTVKQTTKRTTRWSGDSGGSQELVRKQRRKTKLMEENPMLSGGKQERRAERYRR